MSGKHIKKIMPNEVRTNQVKTQVGQEPAALQLKEPMSLSKQHINPLFYSIIVTGVFFLIVLFGLIHHEMWRDELQAWLLARDSHSVFELLKNMRYDGHPPLWHFFLFLITRFTHNPVYMQALHL